MHAPRSRNPHIDTARPGDLGDIVAWHGRYYFEHWGFDTSFEADVAMRLSAFVQAFDPARDGLWVARDADSGGAFAGAVAVNASTAETEPEADTAALGADGVPRPMVVAQLRWFIVPQDFQGRGVGRGLLEAAMAFCRERGIGRVFLWTFEGLDAARALYESCGFREVRAEPRVLGGVDVRMQMLEWKAGD